MPPWGSAWGLVWGPLPAVPVRTKLGALYLDSLEYEDTAAWAAIINTIPASGETDVNSGSAIQLTVTSLVAAALLPDVQIYITRSSTQERILAYNQAAGGFQPGFSGTATVRQSPGSAINDELELHIQPADSWSSLETVTVEVWAEVFGYAAPFEYSYSFTVEDLTAPTIEEIIWYTPRRCRIKFDEDVSMSTSPGGALFIHPAQYGQATVASTSTVNIQGITPLTSWIGKWLAVAGSAYPQNNKARPITAVNATAQTVTVDITGSYGPLIVDDGRDVDSSGILVRYRAISAAVSPYRFIFRSSAEGVGSDDPAAPYQCAYEPFPVQLRQFSTVYDLPAGESADRYVLLDLNDDISFGRCYTIEHSGIEDEWGNESTGGTFDFISPTFNVPEGKLTFWSRGILSELDKKDDLEHDKLLRKLAVVLQDVHNSLQYRVWALQYLWSPDLCAEEWLDHLLYNLGNPFRFPLDSIKKKRLMDTALPDLYKNVGTVTGIVDFIKLYLGITVEITPYVSEFGWVLGDATWGRLGYTTCLHPSSQWARNAYEIVSPIDLTAEQRRAIQDIAEWADPVNMHLARILEPSSSGGGTPVDPTVWIIGTSSLGESTVLA